MTRVLMVVLVVILIASISFFYLFILKPKDNPTVVSLQSGQANSAKPIPVATSSAQVASASASESRLSTLETTVVDLQKQINSLKTTSGQNATALKAPLYIPLGSGAASSSLSWETSDAVQVTIDPSQYPGYSSMQLEMGLRVYQGNGQAFARLYDVDDSQAIFNSDVNSANQDYTWVSSNSFRLPAGSEKYKLQLYTNTTYEASEQNARIKVNF